MKFRIKYADQVVGLFIILALVFFCGIIVLLGANQRWFAKNYRFKTSFESGAGIQVGTAILMKGFQVGKIERITLDEANKLDIDFYIFDTYYPKVKKYSLLEVSTSPIGLGTQLLFHPGKGDELLPEGAFLPELSSSEGQAIQEQELAEIPPKDDTVTRLLANVNPLLENVNKIVVTANRTLTDLNRAMAGQGSGPVAQMLNDASSTVALFPDTVRGVNVVVDDVQSRVAEILDQTQVLIASVNAIAENIETTTEALRDPTGLVPKLLDPKGSLKTLLDDKNAIYNRLILTMDEITKSVKSLSSIVASLNGEMPKIASILEESRTALQKAQDVLEGIKNNPLISGGVPERKEQQSLYQSMRQGEF